MWQPGSYHEFTPDFPEKYAARMVEDAKSSGVSQQQIDQTMREAEQFRQNYHKPAYNIAITFLEVFPVFLGITLFSPGSCQENPRLCQPDHM